MPIKSLLVWVARSFEDDGFSVSVAAEAEYVGLHRLSALGQGGMMADIDHSAVLLPIDFDERGVYAVRTAALPALDFYIRGGKADGSAQLLALYHCSFDFH